MGKYKNNPKVEVKLRRSRTDASWKALWDWLLAPVCAVECGTVDLVDSSKAHEEKDQSSHRRD